MNYCIARPSLLLSKFVKHYWTIENCMPVGQEHIQRIVPNGLSELIFYLGDKPVSKDKNKSINENSVISGQLSEFYDIQISGKLSLFSILFQPQGLSMFLDIPLNELHNQNIPLKFILKNNTNKLENRLFETNSFAERIRIVEQYLFKLFHKRGHAYNYDRIRKSVSLINQSKGVINIDLLASKACLGRKQFERIFLYNIGISPKQFLKIVRFQNTINEKSKDKSISLTDLTYKCGYYDQSHMINDFKKLSGISPKQYFNECEPSSDYFR